MKAPSHPRPVPRQVLLGCLVFGLLCAYSLHYALEASKPRRLAPPSVRLAVSVRSAAPSVPNAQPAAPNRRAPPPILLLPHTRSAPEKSTPAPTPAPAPETVEIVSPRDLPTLEQPALPLAGTGASAVLPPIPSMGVPPSPAEDPFANAVFGDKPGGDIAVFGLLLDDQGFVIDSKILVPSAYSLGDMTVLYAGRGQQWRDLVPPLLPGEQRWIEQRVDQRAIQTPSSVIP